MALLILSVMILPKDNHREENLLNLPEYLGIQRFVGATRGPLNF